MNSMKTPTTRAEFERAFFLLCEKFRGGKFRVVETAETMTESILAVRSLPNKRIDFLSVDESARLTANMMAQPPFTGQGSPNSEEFDEES